MAEIDYEHLSDGAKRKISALALSKGQSISQVLEDVAIEFLAMGGPSRLGRPKAQVVQLVPKEGLKRDT